MIGVSTVKTLALPGCERGLDADEVDARIATARRAVDAGDAVTAFYLLEVDERRLHAGWGFSSTVQYSEERHGIADSKTWRLLRAARACERCDALREAFESGAIGYSTVEVVAPVITGDSSKDAAWVEKARTVGRRALEALVKCARNPDEPPASAVSITLTFAPSQWAVIERAIEKARRIAGAEISHADAVEAMAIELLNTPYDPSEQGEQGKPAPCSATLREACATDGEKPPTCTGVSEAIGGARGIVDEVERDAMFRREILERDGWRCVICGARTQLEVDHIEPRSRAPHRRWDPSNVCVLCHPCHSMKTAGLIELTRLDDGSLQITRPSAWNARPSHRRSGEPARIDDEPETIDEVEW